MRRVIRFEADPVLALVNQARFELLYQAILLGGQVPDRKVTIDVLRKEAAILSALDDVSEADPTLPPLTPTDAGRRVIPGATLNLAQHEHALLLSRLEQVPWLPAAARRVVDTLDWLTTAREPAPLSALAMTLEPLS